MSIHDPQHATLPSTDDPSPGWRVVSFVDPAGTGGDLAFTHGLNAFDLPELLLWARPTEGLDPGADWLLTHRERSRLLNRWALELMAGSLTAGVEREERFDGGHTVARFRFGPPVLASALNHPYLPARSSVISMAWSLLRRAPIVRPPSRLSPTTTRRMDRWIAAAQAVTHSRGLRTVGLDEDVVDAFTQQLTTLSLARPGQARFGPMTPWVNARISQVLSADAEVIGSFLGRLQLARYGRCEDCFLDDLVRLGNRSERSGECREASRVAQELGLTLAGAPEQPTALWRRAVVPSVSPEFAPTTETNLRTVLSDGLELLLVSAVLADVSATWELASACGPWEWALNDDRLPGRLWLARPAVREVARELLAPATPTQLIEAADRSRVWAASPAHQVVHRQVSGLQTTAAASARPGTLFRRDQRQGLPRPVVAAADQLAGQLLAAICVPQNFAPESWDLLRESLYPLAPDLPFDPPTELP